MFSMLIYFFGHPIYFAQLHHVNPLCKHNQENLQRKESSDQKMQENKPVLELKNTKETSQELGNCPMGQREALLKERLY